MEVKVSFLTLDAIESDAQSLLESYGKSFGAVKSPPVPVESILEKHLGLSLDFEDLGIGVLGTTSVEDKSVFIDESLEPDAHPENEGRFNFTIAHELGHWQLHRQFILKNTKDGQPVPVVCRETQRKTRAEYQADTFAACLLIPRALIFKRWRAVTGDTRSQGTKEFSKDLLLALARDFRVSLAAMRARLETLLLLT